MAIQSRPLTYKDLQRLRETRHERLELIEGELFVTPSPTPPHQYIADELVFQFKVFVRRLGYGLVFSAPLDLRLADNTVVQPDLFFVLPDRRPIVTSTRVAGTPSLTVEIVSPSSRAGDRVRKRDIYARFGVPEYWLIDPAAGTVTVFSDPKEGRYQAEHVARDVVRSATIPELSVDLARLFAPIPDA
jgi:Uma2 family endonuclease